MLLKISDMKSLFLLYIFKNPISRRLQMPLAFLHDNFWLADFYLKVIKEIWYKLNFEETYLYSDMEGK